MKSTVLNIRITRHLKELLENLAQSEDISISEFVRDLLLTHAEETKHHIKNYLESIKYVKYASNDFIFLISWLYENRDNNYDDSPEIRIMQIKDIILKIIKDDEYPPNLKIELEKVYIDIIRFCNEPSENRYFYFGNSNHPNSFDYKILQAFINNKGMSYEIY